MPQGLYLGVTHSSCLWVFPHHFLLFIIKDTLDFQFSISYGSPVLSQYECIFNSY